MEHQNCWRILPNGSSVLGIRVHDSECLKFSAAGSRVTVPFRYDPMSGLPVVQDGELLCGSARILHTGTGAYRKSIVGAGGWRGALVHVHTARLAFDDSRSTFLGNFMSAWPGISVHGRTFIQCGRRSHTDQHQLVALEHGEVGYIADQHRRYIRIMCVGGEVTLAPADKGDFAHALVSRAESMETNQNGLSWTRHTLRELGMSHLWTTSLEAKLAALDKQKKSDASRG